MSTPLVQGQRICFSGRMRGGRTAMLQMASDAQLIYEENIRHVEVLVVADSEYRSGMRSQRRMVAEQRGIDVITESELIAQVRKGIASPHTHAPTAKRPLPPKTNALLKGWKPTTVGSINF